MPTEMQDLRASFFCVSGGGKRGSGEMGSDVQSSFVNVTPEAMFRLTSPVRPPATNQGRVTKMFKNNNIHFHM